MIFLLFFLFFWLFFSVGLAALFYFKATETSNTFYNNTYNFTKDIAQLLVKIESGFGERLRNLDEGYSSMRDYLQNNKGNQSSFEDNSASETTKQKIQSERDELEKVLNERNQIIEGLIERSNLQEEEKRSVVADLKRKEEELRKVHQDLNRMNRRLVIERMGQKNRMLGEIDFDSGAVNFTEKVVVKALGADFILKAAPRLIARKFESMEKDFPREYIRDLELEGYYDDGLTEKGHNLLNVLAAKIKG